MESIVRPGDAPVICDGCGQEIPLDTGSLNNFEKAILAKKQAGHKVYCESCWIRSDICPFLSAGEIEVVCKRERCMLWSKRRCGILDRGQTYTSRVVPLVDQIEVEY